MIPTLPQRPRPRLRAGAAAALLALALLAPSARAIEPDYSGWNDLLQRYIKVLREKGKPWDSRFDYEQLYIDEGIWTRHRADGLTTLHTQLLSVTPSDMAPAERTAWAINAYNFLVIERMTLNLLVPGRKFMRYDSPKQVNKDEGSFFAAPVANIEGKPYTLTGFERRFVYGDTTADPMDNGLLPRSKPGDPRLAFAVCKGALGTGPLLPWVYHADSLEKQLDRATRTALALPAYVRVDEQTGELAATNRFFEERCDYGGNELPGVLPFLKKYGGAATQRLIATRKLTRVSRYFEPDWKLNQFEHPAPKLPGAAEAAPPKSH
jgi:uncharacterized protein DUF547